MKSLTVPSTSDMARESNSDRLQKLALPNCHLVEAVLKEHYNVFNDDCRDRLKKLLELILTVNQSGKGKLLNDKIRLKCINRIKKQIKSLEEAQKKEEISRNLNPAGDHDLSSKDLRVLFQKVKRCAQEEAACGDHKTDSKDSNDLTRSKDLLRSNDFLRSKDLLRSNDLFVSNDLLRSSDFLRTNELLRSNDFLRSKEVLRAKDLLRSNDLLRPKDPRSIKSIDYRRSVKSADSGTRPNSLDYQPNNLKGYRTYRTSEERFYKSREDWVKSRDEERKGTREERKAREDKSNDYRTRVQKLEDKSREYKIEDMSRESRFGIKSRESKFEDKFKDHKYEDKFRERKIEDMSRDSRYGIRSRDSRYGMKSRESRFEDKSKEQKYEDKFRECKIEDMSRGSRFGIKSRENKFEDKSTDHKNEDKSRERKIEDMSRDSRFGIKSRENRFEDKSKELKYEDKFRERKIEDMSRETRFGIKSRESPFEDKSKDHKSEDKFKERKIEDMSRDSRFGIKSRENRFEDKSKDHRYEDKLRECKIEDMSRDSRFGIKSRENKFKDKSKDHKSKDYGFTDKSTDCKFTDKSVDGKFVEDNSKDHKDKSIDCRLIEDKLPVDKSKFVEEEFKLAKDCKIVGVKSKDRKLNMCYRLLEDTSKDLVEDKSMDYKLDRVSRKSDPKPGKHFLIPKLSDYNSGMLGQILDYKISDYDTQKRCDSGIRPTLDFNFPLSEKSLDRRRRSYDYEAECQKIMEACVDEILTNKNSGLGKLKTECIAKFIKDRQSRQADIPALAVKYYVILLNDIQQNCRNYDNFTKELIKPTENFVQPYLEAAYECWAEYMSYVKHTLEYLQPYISDLVKKCHCYKPGHPRLKEYETKIPKVLINSLKNIKPWRRALMETIECCKDLVDDTRPKKRSVAINVHHLYVRYHRKIRSLTKDIK